MREAFSYLRLSGRGQLDGDGLERQRECIAKYCQANDIEVVEEFRDEGVSGTKELSDREGLTALFDSLDSNGVRLVLIERTDRLARDLIVGEILLGQFRERCVSVIECEGSQDLVAGTDPTRTLVRQILGAVCQFDKSSIVAKLKAARDRIRKRQGRCEGGKPFGIKPGEGEAVSRIKSLRQQSLTLVAIANQLNAEGVPTRTGAKWSRWMVKKVLDRLTQ